MRCAFAYGLKEMTSAAILSCLIAGVVTEMTSPSVAGNNAEVVTISVNRAHKGDRLPQASLPPDYPTLTEMAPVAPKPVPLGCDPVFSPVVDPASAHIFKRCIT